MLQPACRQALHAPTCWMASRFKLAARRRSGTGTALRGVSARVSSALCCRCCAAVLGGAVWRPVGQHMPSRKPQERPQQSCSQPALQGVRRAGGWAGGWVWAGQLGSKSSET